MLVAAPATMSGASTTARPTSPAGSVRARSIATSTARWVLAEPSRQTRISMSEHHERDGGEHRREDRDRPHHVAEEARHPDVVLLGDRLDHEVRAIADVGHR